MNPLSLFLSVIGRKRRKVQQAFCVQSHVKERLSKRGWKEKHGPVKEEDVPDTGVHTMVLHVNDELQAKLAEYNSLRAEIQARSDLQNRILQIHVTSLGLIFGAVLANPANYSLLLVVAISSPLFGMWFLDHAFTIEHIGRYIALRIEIPINNSIIGRHDFLRWESGHLPSVPKPFIGFNFGFIQIATFLVPIMVVLLFVFFVLWNQIWAIVTLDAVCDFQSKVPATLWRAESTTLIDRPCAGAWYGRRWTEMAVTAIACGMGLYYYKAWREWRSLQKSRTVEIERVTVEEFLQVLFANESSLAAASNLISAAAGSQPAPTPLVEEMFKNAQRLRSVFGDSFRLTVTNLSAPISKRAEQKKATVEANGEHRRDREAVVGIAFTRDFNERRMPFPIVAGFRVAEGRLTHFPMEFAERLSTELSRYENR